MGRLLLQAMAETKETTQKVTQMEWRFGGGMGRHLSGLWSAPDLAQLSAARFELLWAVFERLWVWFCLCHKD